VAETLAEIPDREVFKASEVCEIAQVQPYVLRSWEHEFPTLGVAKGAGGQRVYRRGDVERVLRIRQLVFGEGLTLAGARRRLDGDEPKVEDAPLPAIVDDDTRTRLAEIKRELRSLLDMLDGAGRAAAPGQPAAGPEPLLQFDESSGTAWPPPGKAAKKKGSARGQ
jgi:DNA-binding transcriptional MerR regulator